MRILVAVLMFAVSATMFTAAFRPLPWAPYVAGGLTALALVIFFLGPREKQS